MGKGESILVVDDVKEQRDLAAEMLRKLNYNVTSVSSGEEAVAYLKEHHVDLDGSGHDHGPRHGRTGYLPEHP